MEGKIKGAVLVVSAHPDDELLGCGGTIALHTRVSEAVTTVIACEGESLRYSGKNIDLRSMALEAGKVIGVEDIRMLGFPDQRLDTLSLVEIITPLEKIIREVEPRVIYCQYGGDVNRDHELLFKALLVATRPIEPCIEAIYAFDTASSTEWGYPRSFVPDTWVDISSTLELKLEALKRYGSELREYPHPRSLEALRKRAEAYGNQCCLQSAEVFMTIRRVCRDGKTPL